MPIRATHTLAIMQLPPIVVALIRGRLEEAGYTHAIDETPDGVLLDMTGIGIAAQADEVDGLSHGALLQALDEYPKRNTHQLQSAKVCAGVIALAAKIEAGKAAPTT